MSDEIAEARSKETFVSNVSGRPDSSLTHNEKKKSGKGFFKKHSPLILILGLLVAFVGLIFVSQSFMPFALVNRFIEEYNGAGIASILRSDSLLDTQLSSAGTYFGLSENQRTALKDGGIYPVDFSAEGYSVTALVYEESAGNWRAVVPKLAAESSSDLNSKIAGSLSGQDITLSGSPLTVEEALKLSSFKDKYTVASKTWRGGNAGWYDSLEDLTEARLAIRRTRFNNWATAGVTGATTSWKKLAAGTSSASDTGISDYGTYNTGTDADGNPTTDVNAGSIDASSLSNSAAFDKVRDVLNSKITSVAKVVATAGCAGVEIMSAIQTYMAAQQTIQYLNLATGYFEAVQSAQVGKNNGDPMNEYNKILTTPDPETGKTPMEASTSAELFSGTPISSEDETVKTVNFETLMSSLGTLTGDLNFTAQAFEACSYVKMGVATLNFATTVISFIPGVGQAVKAIHILVKAATRLALGLAFSSIAGWIVPKILTQVFKNVAQNIATEWTGVDYFHAMSSGASKYLSGNFQTGGGTAASKESLAAYNRVKNDVIATEAETERRLKSPLDLSSRYTFFGSIVYSLIPLATSSSVGSAVKNIGSIFTSTVSSAIPSASAVAETNLNQSLGSCPVLESVGAVGDALCNRIEVDVVDEDIINMSNEDLRAKILAIDPNSFKGKDSNGRDIINPDSTLGKVAAIINQRVAPLGVADATATSVIVNKPSSLISSIPLIGDMAQFTSALSEAENMPWISGSAGVNSDANPLWKDVKYCEEYVKRDRWMEVAGITQKSSVTAMLEEFYEEHPLDNSREGVIARFSGMTRDEVVAVEDTLEVMTYLANYNPEERLDFLAVADGSLRANPQTPTVQITTLAESSQRSRRLRDVGSSVVIWTTASRPACGERSDGPARRESFVTA